MSDRLPIHGQDIVCFSSIDWHFIWQGHQEIMSTLAANGNRVLFVENTGVRAPSMRDLPRVRQRIGNWWRSTKGFRQERENLFIYSPMVLPFPYSALVRRINRSLLTRGLNRWMRAAGFGRPIVWTFLPTALIRQVIRDLDPAASIYYCIDDFSSSSHSARRIAKSEAQLFREADLVFVTSENLKRKALQFRETVTLFPFGVSFAKFERVRMSPDQVPEDLARLPRPVVGYVGGVHQWVDLPMLTEAARRTPAASFAVVGPLQVEVGGNHPPNLHFFGKRAHDDVPRYIKGFDVGIVPYVLSEYTANVYPTKLNEYLAMGIPVVATDLPEIRRFNAEHGDSVVIAKSTEQFVAGVQAALAPSTEQQRLSRISIAKQNSWHSRISAMCELIEQVVEAKRGRPDPWEAKLRYLYRRTRERALAISAALAVLFILLFYTPVPWIVASPLRVSAPAQQADAIVVLAGGVGESGQAGGGYQERVKMAAQLYHAGYAPKMIFESGYAFAFREAEIMRDLAVSVGVPPDAILLETTGINTYDDVMKLKPMLEARGWRKILLVSSPYHMRRALLVWRKNAPAVEVVPTPVAESQFYAHDRGASLDQLRGLVREYGALAAYWWEGLL